ncbi:MAG: bifunctional adenosylcobinamide kinase/adenosylcobinamide-phosphate guanylyltransferase [Candidatus Thiodiazotropha sp.]|jgi:adenosylcobinamide kinase / adenosylcobinamide-phosphate guanylyltransferase
MKTLILGGVRSGKSRLAEQLARESGLALIYLATARPDDPEMEARIAHHRSHRADGWCVVEEPCRLADALLRHARADRCVLVECLTLWLTNLLLAPGPGSYQREREALLAALPTLPGRIILVGNETNLGVVPLGELSRRFCDESGRLHQALAQICERVFLTVAGLPLTLKGESD